MGVPLKIVPPVVPATAVVTVVKLLADGAYGRGVFVAMVENR